MEAYGIYSMCRIHNISEWIIVKGICDWGYNKDNPNKENDQIMAAHAAVNFCFHVFSRDGAFPTLLRNKIPNANHINTEVKTITDNENSKHNKSVGFNTDNESRRIVVDNNGATIEKQVNMNIETMTGDIHL